MPADIDPAPTDAGSEPDTQTSHRRWINVLLMIAVWLVPVACAIGGGLLIRSDLKRKQQARVDAAMTEVREAVKAADDWLKQGRARDAENVEHRLTEAMAATDVSDKAIGVAALERLRTRRAERAADSRLDLAKTHIESRAVAEALPLLRQYVADPHATKKPEAQQLLADCEVATSDSAALNALVAMSDEQFARFKSAGKTDDRKVAYPFLAEMRVAALRRSLETAGQRRAENKIAEAKRQAIADAAHNPAANDPANSTDAVQGRSVAERMVGVWSWGPGENEMKFAADGTFVERCTWGVLSQGRWSFDKEGSDWVHGNIRLDYDNKMSARVALSRKDDRIIIEISIPRVNHYTMGGGKIPGNPSWWDPPSPETLRAKMVGIWRWGPGESEVKFAPDGTFLERNSWGVASQGLWRIDKDRCDLQWQPTLAHVLGIPVEGKNLVIVAAVKGVLHFRIFDALGMFTVDTNEKALPEQAGPIENLRKLLAGLSPPHVLTDSEKDRVITAVRSIVGRTREADKDLTVRLDDDKKCSAIVRVNLSGDRIFIEPINRHGGHDDRREGTKTEGNSTWWTDQSERIRAKLVDEWHWGDDHAFSITFAQDGTFVDTHPWGMELRGRWSVEKDGSILLKAENKLKDYSIFISPVARINLKEDTILVGHNSGRSGSDSYSVASRYREKPITEAEVLGVWVHEVPIDEL